MEYHDVQPVYIKHVKILDLYLSTGWNRVCEIRVASTGVICGNPYPVCKNVLYILAGPFIQRRNTETCCLDIAPPHISCIMGLVANFGTGSKKGI